MEDKDKKPADIKSVEDQIQAMLEAANKKIEKMFEGAEERAEKIVTSARQAVAPKREVKQEPMVTIKLRKDKEKNNTDLPVSINGKTYLVQRGVWVSVPLAVAEIIESSDRQEEYAIQYSEGLATAFNEKLKALK